MELTPELFEKIEFAERRKGYDTEQVETFLEQAGTALAQLLARVRHTEERAAHAETRLAEAEQKLTYADQVLAEADRRVQQAEERLQQAAQQPAAAVSTADEDAEVEQAARTLLLARRTADETISEARAQAQSMLDEARGRAERDLAEARAEAELLSTQAKERAEAEYAQRRSEALSEVQLLQGRRAQLNDVIQQLETRLAGYRAELTRSAEELLQLVDDPERLGTRPNLSIRADEVLTTDPATVADPATEPAPAAPEPSAPAGVAAEPAAEAAAGATAAPAPAATHDAEPQAEASAASAPSEPAAPAQTPTPEPDATGEAPAPQAAEPETPPREAHVEDEGEQTAFLDLTGAAPDAQTEGGAAAADSERWGPGSWSQLESELEVEDDEPTQAVPAGVHRDRYMEELDSAVNEAVDLDDDAMKAFFEGAGESRARRFGWRR